MGTYYIVFNFILGILCGSFFNVVGYRLPKEESIVFPASHCPNCNHKLGPLELIPIISYFFLGGKCKECKQKISIIYPIFELTTGALFALSYYLFGFSINYFIALTVVSVLLIIIISDIRYFIIPDEVLLVGIILLLLEKLLLGGWQLGLESLFDGVIAFLIMYLVKIIGDFMFKKESMGGGDIKLLFFFGLFLGWELSLISIFLASFIGLPISLYILLKNKSHIIPFGPFLSIAALILFFSQININDILNCLIF